PVRYARKPLRRDGRGRLPCRSGRAGQRRAGGEPGRCDVLDELGWDKDWAELAGTYGAGATPARVARSAAGRLLLVTGSGQRPGTAPAGTAPVTGDWVLTDGDVVTHLLPRRTELVRGAGRRAARGQVLAANVDVVLVVVALATAPNLGRLARMLAVAWDSGAQPVVVLTKADL